MSNREGPQPGEPFKGLNGQSNREGPAKEAFWSIPWPEILPWTFGMGVLTPRPYTTRELLTLEVINWWELPQRQPLLHKSQHHPTASSTLCRMPHPNNKEDRSTNPVISRQDHHIQPCPSEGGKPPKLTSCQNACISHPLHEAYENHWTNLMRAETKGNNKFNLKVWENGTSDAIH